MFREPLPANNFYSKDLEIKKSSIEDAGLGVFTKENINKRELVEVCPVIVFDYSILAMFAKERKHLHVLNDYVFRWPDGQTSICLGKGSLYNHSKDFNLTWKYREIHPFAIEFWSTKNIKSGEELFINYGIKSEFG